jgi:hypothetical protein
MELVKIQCKMNYTIITEKHLQNEYCVSRCSLSYAKFREQTWKLYKDQFHNNADNPKTTWMKLKSNLKVYFPR